MQTLAPDLAMAATSFGLRPIASSLVNTAQPRLLTAGSQSTSAASGRKWSRWVSLNVLFSAPPGTGKTFATEVLAHELALDLYQIDLSQMVSKYIGETEKNLNRVFAVAVNSNAMPRIGSGVMLTASFLASGNRGGWKDS